MYVCDVLYTQVIKQVLCSYKIFWVFPYLYVFSINQATLSLLCVCILYCICMIIIIMYNLTMYFPLPHEGP